MPGENELNQEQDNNEIRNPYNLPDEVVEKAKEKAPMGDCVQPIGAWWQPDPAKQYQVCPIGKSSPDA